MAKKQKTDDGGVAVAERPEGESVSTEASAPATTKKPPTEVKTVTMLDGRIVEFPGKRKMLKEGGKDASGALFVRIDWVNGETRTYGLNPKLLEDFALHGAGQKYGDEAAGIEDPDDQVEALDKLDERLQKGEWSQAREAGDSFSGASIIIKAMALVTGKSREEVKAYIEKTLEQYNQGENKLSRQKLYAQIRANQRFGPTITQMEAEKATKSNAPTVTFEGI